MGNNNEKGKIKSEYKNHLIIGNFEHFDFEKLQNENESKDYEGILWKNGYIDKNGKKHTDLIIQKDDTVYIFYNNLPDRISRILIRCTVLDTSYDNENCFYYQTEEEKEEMMKDKNKRIPAIRLKVENALCVEDDNYREKFSKDKLLNEYGINNLQGKQHLKEDLLQKKLIEELEKTCKSNKYKNYTLDKLREYMNKISKCTLEGCKKGNLKSQNHQTFQKENGMNYYEAHHLIEQCNGRNDEKFPKEIIDDPLNIINLCSNCHKRIHNGRKEDRKIMVTFLYELHKDYYDQLLSKVKEVKNGEKPLKWLLKQYGVKD